MLLLALAGCAADVQTASDFATGMGLRKTPDTTHYDPRYRYLRLTFRGRALPMILGYVEGLPGPATDVWYSGGGEVLRLRDGMVTGSAGLPLNWTDVSYSAWPDWTQHTQTLTRRRDVQPGYRFGLVDALRIEPVAPPSDSQIAGVAPASLRWFVLTDSGSPKHLFYAVRGSGASAEVVYGEQCLGPELCLSWQQWPPRAAGTAR